MKMKNNRGVVLLAGLAMVAGVASVGCRGGGPGAPTTAAPDASVEQAIARTDVIPPPQSDASLAPLPAPAAAADAGAQPGGDLRAASEIRSVVRQYLKTSRAAALRNLPSDWGKALPRDAGEPAALPPPTGGFALPPWRLEIDGDRAKLTYVPPGGITRNSRAWFQLDLERAPGAGGAGGLNARDGGWKTLPPGITFAHGDPRIGGPK